MQLALFRLAVIAGGEAAGLVQAAQECVERPILLRYERLDLALALDDQARRDGLHASGGQPPAHFFPQQRTELVADDAVKNASGLLRVDEVIVDVARLTNAPGDDALRDLVERHTSGFFVRDVEKLLQMP